MDYRPELVSYLDRAITILQERHDELTREIDKIVGDYHGDPLPDLGKHAILEWTRRNIERLRLVRDNYK